MDFMSRRRRAGEVVTSASDERAREFERLAMPLIDSLFNFARWLTRNSEEAEDLVQETYMKAWKAYASFRGDCSLRTWLFVILRNTWFSSQAVGWATQMEPLDEERHEAFLPIVLETPESLLVDQRRLSAIRTAISELPVAMREIILLREVEEMSYQEISTVLEVPIGTVMSRLARARRQLRDAALKTLGEAGNDPR